jgi:peptidoglycan hydrolase-like protein with peptidoglycan-binding domain
VQKFQEKYGIAGPGDEGYGQVGPKTRAKLNEVAGQTAPAAPAAPAAPPSAAQLPEIISFTRPLEKGMTHSDIKALQQLLNQDPDTRVAASGDGSPGNETSYFGSATRRAVEKFQEKYGIAGPGTSGYGDVGPRTRAKLNELLTGGITP